MAVAIFFILIFVAVPLYLMLVLVFPVQYARLIAFIYDPINRVALLSLFFIVYFIYHSKRRHTSYSYNYFDDLSIRSARLSGETYHYRLIPDEKNEILSMVLFVDGLYGYDFMLKFEGALERWLKAIHLIYECQTGDRRSDKSIYIISDDRELCRLLRSDDKLRNEIFDIFWQLRAEEWNVKYLKAFDGRLELMAVKKGKIDHDAERKSRPVSEKAVMLMRGIIGKLPQKADITDRVYREKSGFAFMIVFGVLSLFFVNGAVKLFVDSVLVKTAPMVTDHMSLLWLSAGVTAVLLTLYLILTAILFYKSTRLAPAVFVGLTYGTLAFFLTALTGVKEADIYLDNNEPTVRIEKVTDKRESHGKYTSYHVTFSKMGEIRTGASFYRKFQLGDCAEIYIRPGFLGLQWVGEIKKSDKGDC